MQMYFPPRTVASIQEIADAARKAHPEKWKWRNLWETACKDEMLPQSMKRWVAAQAGAEARAALIEPKQHIYAQLMGPPKQRYSMEEIQRLLAEYPVYRAQKNLHALAKSMGRTVRAIQTKWYAISALPNAN